MKAVLNLEQSTPRVFAAGYHANKHQHVATFGELPTIRSHELLEEIRRSELLGRGGASFSTFHKMVTTERHGNITVIANGAEGEVLSFKDRLLIEHAPHLVIDGLQIVARLLGASRVVLYARSESLQRAQEAISQRNIETLLAPGTYISGESTAVARTLLEGISKPLDNVLHLNRAEETSRTFFGTRTKTRGPIVVQNVETLAHLALIARYGATWFRSATQKGGGTRLFTVHQRDHHSAQVLELPDGRSTEQILAQAGQHLHSEATVLVGGFSGSWVTSAQLSQPLKEHGEVSPGTGIIYPLTALEDPLTVTASMLNYLATENAGQCGPCVNGLPALADAFSVATQGHEEAKNEVFRLGQMITGRGLCKHPDATARFAQHTMQKFLSSVTAETITPESTRNTTLIGV